MHISRGNFLKNVLKATLYASHREKLETNDCGFPYRNSRFPKIFNASLPLITKNATDFGCVFSIVTLRFLLYRIIDF